MRRRGIRHVVLRKKFKYYFEIRKVERNLRIMQFLRTRSRSGFIFNNLVAIALGTTTGYYIFNDDLKKQAALRSAAEVANQPSTVEVKSDLSK